MTNETHSEQAPLSTDLEALRTRMKDQSFTLGELKQALKDRGWTTLFILLALPFRFVAIPGLSTWVFIGLTSVLAIGGFRWLWDSFRC